MAKGRKTVNIGIKLPSKTEANKQLEELLSSISKLNSGVKIDLDISNATKTFKEFSTMLDRVGKQLSNFGAWDKFFTNGAITDEIKNTNKLADAMYNLNQKSQIAKQERDKIWQNKNASAINKSLDDEYKYSLKLQDSIDKMQSKLNISKNNSFIDDSVINNLQKKLDSINTDTPKREIEELKNAIKNLSSSDSQIVRLQNTIEKLKINTESLKGKYGNLVGDNQTSSQLKAYENQILNLKNTLNSINQGEVFDNKKITSSINSANNSFKELETSVKNSGNALRLSQKDAVSFGGAIKDIATKVGIFSIVNSGMHMLGTALRDGVRDVISMDDALTDLNKVVDISKKQLLEMRDSAVSMGKELGRSSIEVANAQAEFGRQYKDLDKINELTRVSIMGANVMDNTSADQVAKGLTTVITSMKKDASESMTILDQMNEIQNNYRISANDMLDALSEVGSVAYTSGAQLERVQGYITAISVATGESGSEIGNALRSVMSRVYKLGAEGLEAEGKPEKMLASIGVAVRDAKGEFRDFPNILDDLNVKWKTMSDTQKIAIAQTVGGIHRYNQFMTLMNNYQMATDATTTAMNSQGSALKENEVYMNSASAKLGILKTTTEEFMYNFINSDMLKGGIDALTKLVGILDKMQQSFGSLGMSVGIATTAFLMFTNNPLKELAKNTVSSSDGLNKLNKDIANTSTSTTTATGGLKILGTAFDTTKIKAMALQSVMSVGLGLAIGVAVSLFSNLIDSMITTQAELKEMNDEFNNSFTTKTDNISNAEKLLTQYKSISSEMGNLKQNSDEYKTKEQELLDIQNQLVGIYPELNQYLKDNADAKNGVADATQNLINKSKEELAGESRAILKENDIGDTADLDKMIAKFQTVKDEYYKLMELDKQGVEVVGTGYFDSMTGLEEMRNVEDVLKSTKSEYESLTTVMETVRNAISNVASEYPQYAGSLQLIDDLLKSETESLQQNTQAKEENANVQYQHLSPEEAVEGVKQATQEYGKANKEANELRKTIAEINENGLSTDIITDLSEKYSELGYKINDAGAVQEYLNQKLSEQEQIAQQSYTNMMMNDAQFYQDKIANNEEFTNAFNSMLDTMVQNDGQACDIELGNYTNLLDLKNDLQNRFGDATGKFLDGYINIFMSAYTFDSTQYASLQEAKTGYLNQTLGAVAQWASQFVGVSAQSYSKDLSNFNSLSDAKAKVLSDLNARMKVIQQNYNDLLSDAKARADEMGDPTFNNSRALASAGKELREIQGAIAGVNVAFQGLEVGYNKLNTSFNAGSFKGANLSKDKKDKGGSKASEKQVEDIDNLKDRYYELDLALQKVENSMAMLNTQMKNAKDEEKIKLIKEEVALLTKKKQALENIYKEQQKEIQDYRNALYSQGGFTFNGDDTIHNYTERMDELQRWSNSFSNPDDKKNAQEQYQSLAKMVEEYTQLISKTVPETKEKIEDIQNAITSAYQEEADIMKKQVDKHKDMVEKRYDNAKKAIEREKELYNRKRDDEDRQDDISEKQRKLNELKAELDNALRTGDESLIKNIQLQMAEAQKELDNYIRDTERDKANQMFEDEQNALDEELQRKLDMIEEKLGDEDLLQYAMQGITDLTSVITDIDKTTTGVNRSFMMVSDTVTSIGDNIKTSWISGLDEVSAKIKEMSSELNNSFDFGNVQPILNGVISPITTELKGKNQEITLNFGGIEKLDITKTNSDEIKNALEDNFNKIIKEVMNIIGG